MKNRVLSCLIFFLPLMVCAQDIKTVVDRNNEFTFRLYNELRNSENGNLFLSPFSISTALAMTYAGARGETARQVRETMGFPQGKEFHSSYQKMLKTIKEGTEGKITLNLANGLWAQKDFQFLDSYFEMVKSNYSSELKNVDFKDKSMRETVRREINSWVEERTNNKIKDLIAQEVLKDSTKLVLVNAIYFYGHWEVQFEKKLTRPDYFMLSEETRKEVPFMNIHGHYQYYEESGFKVLQIPYAGNTASMVIFLPDEINGMDGYEEEFGYKRYLGILESLQDMDVWLSLPRFKTTITTNLKESLSKMGMPQAFSIHADFSGMTFKPGLKIDEVIQRAFVEVDESGTEAAAATAVIMSVGSARPLNDIKVFKADHPFIFLIKDNVTGSILFMGKINDPGTLSTASR